MVLIMFISWKCSNAIFSKLYRVNIRLTLNAGLRCFAIKKKFLVILCQTIFLNGILCKNKKFVALAFRSSFEMGQ